MTQPNQPTAIVRDALADLRPFQILDRSMAAAVLAMWRRRTELTNDDLHAVLGAFRSPTANRGAELRDEMAANHDPGRLPTLTGYNANRPRLPYPLADPAIFGTVEQEFGPMYAELAPEPLAREFPAELAEAPEFAAFAHANGRRWDRSEAGANRWIDGSGRIRTTRELVADFGRVLWFDSTELLIGEFTGPGVAPAELGADGIKAALVDELGACTTAVGCPVHRDARGLHNFDSTDVKLRGALAWAKPDGRLDIGAKLTGPLAQVAIDREYADPKRSSLGELIGIHLNARGWAFITGGTR